MIYNIPNNSMCGEKLMKRHKSYCFGNQRKERENEADRDIAMLIN